MAKVTAEMCKAARHSSCKWSDEDVANSFARGGGAEQELADVIARFVASPAGEHRDRAYIVRKLLTHDQRRRVGMLHGPDPLAYMRKALAVVQADDQAASAPAPAAPAAPTPSTFPIGG